MLLNPSPRRRGLVTLLLVLLAVVARAQLTATVSTSQARVQGLHYSTGHSQQEATWTFSVTPGGYYSTLYFVEWSVDGATAATYYPPNEFHTFQYTATGTGKHTITAYMSYAVGVTASKTVVAIGGPLSFGVTGAQSGLSAPSHDLTAGGAAEDGTKPWYLQYFGYDRSGGTIPTGYQASQYGTVAAPAQPFTGTTTYDWHLDAGLKKNASTSSASDIITAFADGSSGGSGLAVHCTFTYTDSNETGLTGSADDDTDETPPSGSLTANVNYYRFSAHIPESLTQAFNPSTYRQIAGPGYKPGVQDTYTMTLKDSQGMPMPSVWVAERFSNMEFPPGPSRGVWTTGGVGSGCGQYLDYIFGQSNSNTAYPKPGPDLGSLSRNTTLGLTLRPTAHLSASSLARTTW